MGIDNSIDSDSRETGSSVDFSPSEVDSLDSELVRETLEYLEEEEDLWDSRYDISIMEYETGTNHKVQNVGVSIMSETCRMLAEGLSFTSSSCSKGAKADLVISKSLGPGMSDCDLIVYQGELSYTYSDALCYPTSLSA